MHFYLPNFDDLVDPEYNFITDEHSRAGGERWQHDVYAHELYGEPICDGLLMSKTLITERQEKAILEAGGIRRFLRLPEDLPVMGDCGAFSYVKEPEPPYTTDEILDYYQTLGFTYGVSIDHLIFGSFPDDEKRRRWEITLRNAEGFLARHRAGGYSFIPIGIAQGWDPASYRQGIERLVTMGYDHLALGGLARSNDRKIVEVLKAVHPALPPEAKLHIFAIARLSMVPDFIRLGVTSADSASPLRRAWLGASSNYWTHDGERYAAIRVPFAQRRGGRKRGIEDPEEIVKNNDVTLEELQALERRALKILRDYDTGQADLEETLEAVLEYDRLYGDKRDHAVTYRRTLEDQPWKHCGCKICQKLGIEVIIFRGNNRNRRRGFHNMKVFYDQFRQTVAACSQPQERPQWLERMRISSAASNHRLLSVVLAIW